MASQSQSELKRLQKPLMLKDFLLLNSSSSSNGFVSFPRRPPGPAATTVRKLLQIDLRPDAPRRSCAASALRRASEKVINAVKHFPFYSRPKQASFTRSLSRPLKRSFWKKKILVAIRWKSSSSSEEEEDGRKGPLDVGCGASSPSSCSCSWLESESECSSDAAAQSSSGSSESSGENEGPFSQKTDSQKYHSHVGDDSMDGETKQEQEQEQEQSYGDMEQLSPVSVLDRHACEDAESPSSPALPIPPQESSNQIHENFGGLRIVSQIRPTNLYKHFFQSKVEEEEYEDEEDCTWPTAGKAKDLLSSFRARHGKGGKGIEQLMLDFFREGLGELEACTTRSWNLGEEESIYKEKLLREAGNWMSRDGGRGLGLEHDKKAYVEGMEEGGRWRSFAVEEEELVFEVEGLLLEELILDLL